MEAWKQKPALFRKVSNRFHDYLAHHAYYRPIKSALFFDQSEVNITSNLAPNIFPRFATAASYAHGCFSLFLFASRGHLIDLMFFPLSLGTH